MFKKIILSLILLSNVIFAKNDIDEFGQFVDKEGYIDYKSYYPTLYPENYPEFYSEDDEYDFIDKLREGNRNLRNWNSNIYDMWERNKEYLDDKGYINNEFIKKKARSLPKNKDDFIKSDKNFREKINNDFLALSDIVQWGEDWENEGDGRSYDWGRYE